MTERLHFLIRTPHEVLFEAQLLAARVPTETGQVGLRARAEPLLLVVEPGLVVLRRAPDERQFAATAGGLLQVERSVVALYTPFAALGDDEQELLQALDRAFAVPDSELSARRKLGELERRILRELSQRGSLTPTGGGS